MKIVDHYRGAFILYMHPQFHIDQIHVGGVLHFLAAAAAAAAAAVVKTVTGLDKLMLIRKPGKLRSTAAPVACNGMEA